VRVRRSREGRLWWCYRFNALILTRDGRRQNKELSKDEVEVVSSCWLNGKET
jgi:hypothetical protein